MVKYSQAGTIKEVMETIKAFAKNEVEINVVKFDRPERPHWVSNMDHDNTVSPNPLD